MSWPSLNGALALMARRNPDLGRLAPVVWALLQAGVLEQDNVAGERYFWLVGMAALRHQSVPQDLRILAPFDPLVWDRRRFEHLWGWAYRFEAYMPPAKRQFGYYAMPLLWGNRVIGWANLAVAQGQLQVKLGYAGVAPRSQAFQRALDAELSRFRRFLALQDQSKPQSSQPWPLRADVRS